MRKKILRHFLPLIVAFVAAFIFFLGYNHYLLDTSLANLKISLKELRNAKNLDDVKTIADVLSDTFLAEVCKGDFDLAFAVKLEVSTQMLEAVSKDIQTKNENFVVRMASASDITFAARVSENVSEETQIKDIEHFIEEAIERKTEKRPFFISKIEDIAIAIFPGKRKDNSKELKEKITNIEKKLSSYKGDKLQEKYLEIAKMYFLLKDWQMAYSYLNKSLKINPTNAVGLKTQFFLGVLYKAKGDFKEASLAFNKIKAHLPKEWKWFCSYQEADCLYKSGETDKAVSLFEMLYKEESSSAIPQLAQFNAAYIYLYDFKNIPKAQESLAKLKENKVETTSLYSYIEHKINPDMASEYCRQGFKLIEEGLDSSLTEKYKESLDKFDLALKIIARHGTSRIGKALGYYFLNNPEEAIDEGLEAKRIDPSNDEVLANLGFIYYNLNMIDKAIAQYEEAIKINPNSHIYNYNLATLYAVKEKYSRAKDLFRKAIRTNPKYPYAHNNLGYVLWKEGEYYEAKESLKKAIALNQDYVDAHYNLGAVYYTLGNYEEARKEFIQVDKLQPNFRQTKQYLKQINKKLGYN